MISDGASALRPYHAPAWRNPQRPVESKLDLQVMIKQLIIQAEEKSSRRIGFPFRCGAASLMQPR